LKETVWIIGKAVIFAWWTHGYIDKIGTSIDTDTVIGAYPNKTITVFI
jgi:hypothetical protein